MSAKQEKLPNYQLESLCCHHHFEDKKWELNCPFSHEPALIRSCYTDKLFEIKELPGIYRFSCWLPINKILEGSAAPVTYKSEHLAKKLGLSNLHITFNGYWPEKGAWMKTASFKECEAYSVCARYNPNTNKIMVVASAGNTARAFAKVCSENKIPLLICIPEDNLNSLWFEKELDNCVKIVATEKGSDYFDAIHLSNIACEIDRFFPEGGAKNVARRDGMGTTVLSAISTFGKIPDYYFQAIGSGTGAIAAWEANLRFIEDGRFGNHFMKLVLSQNEPFTPIKLAWDKKSREIMPISDEQARKDAAEINAKVLANRKPPYSLTGGLFDALSETEGEVLSITNQEASEASEIFNQLEKSDIDPAAAVAVASLIKKTNEKSFDKNAVIMLNITGGGAERFKQEHKTINAKADYIFRLNTDKEEIKMVLNNLF